MVVNHNIYAFNAFRQLSAINTVAIKSLQKLSSGLRINSAADDAAGLAISEKMKGQIRGLEQASRNAQDGISLIQTAEGALKETHSILQRIRELAVQSASDTNTDGDRAQIQMEADQLTHEINKVATDTQFNTKNLLNGSLKVNPLNFQIGANSNQNVSLSIDAMDADALGISGGAESTTTATGTVTGGTPDLASVTFGSGLGSKITNGAHLTFTYSANTVTISDGTPADDQNIAVNATDTSFTVSSGNFQGMTVNLAAGKTVSDLTGSDGVSIALSASTAGTVTGGTSGTTTLVKYDASGITSTVTGTPAFATDGEDITLTYTPGTPMVPGQPANFVSSLLYASDLKGAISASSDAYVSIMQNGVTMAPVMAAQMRSFNSGAGVQNGSDMYNLVKASDAAAYTWSNPAAQTWGIQAGGAGALTNVVVTVVGSNASERSAIEALFGMTGDSKTVYGSNDAAEVPSTVTIADNNGHSQIVNAWDTDTSVTGTGYFTGLSVSINYGKTAFYLDGTDNYGLSFSNVTTPGTPANVASVAFGGGLGGKITNGAALTFTYSAGNVTISNGTPADDQTIAANAADTSFTVSSGNYKGMTVNLAAGKTASDLTGTDGVTISQSTSANGSVSGATGGVASVTFGSLLGGKITNGANLTFTYGAGTVTISNGTPADDQTISVNATDTSFTVSSGNYGGMTVNLAAGKKASDLTSGSDGVSISLINSSGVGVDISTQTGANAAISVIDSAISAVFSQRADLGAMQNRLEHTISNLGSTSENLTAAESRIRDADMAREIMEYTKISIFSQAATAMLAQANQTPQEVLQLLKSA